MTLSLADIDKIIDDMRSSATTEPNHLFISPATYRELHHINDRAKRGKPYIRAKRKRHKSLMRMPRELRMRLRRENFIRGPYWYAITAIDAEGRVIRESSNP